MTSEQWGKFIHQFSGVEKGTPEWLELVHEAIMVLARAQKQQMLDAEGVGRIEHKK